LAYLVLGLVLQVSDELAALLPPSLVGRYEFLGGEWIAAEAAIDGGSGGD